MCLFTPRKKTKVALIVGHCSSAPGATNQTNGVSEYLFNKNVVEVLVTLVSKFSECKIITRDKSEKDEVEKVNAYSPDVAFSFHANGFAGEASGSEVLYCLGSAKGAIFAPVMLDHIYKALGLRKRGIKGIKESERGWYFLSKTVCPALILEPFFITSDGDFQIAVKNMTQLIEEYAKGIQKCLEENR